MMLGYDPEKAIEAARRRKKSKKLTYKRLILKMRSMRVLIDTNVLIYREDGQAVSSEISTLMHILSKTHTDVLLHPASLEDILRDKNEERKRITLSKVRAYQTLENAPIPDKSDEFFKQIGAPKKENDEVDNLILYSVYRDAVGFLITNDDKIHSKASNLGISDRVFYPDESIEFFKKELPSSEPVPKPFPLKKGFVSDLDCDDPIFDTLKRDYPEFNEWFTEISRGGRECYYNRRIDGTLGAIMIYKFEEEPIPSNPPQPSMKRLKIATLKVSHEGNKIGELLLKVAFGIAAKNNLSQVYLTHFVEDEDRLVYLINQFGFRHVGNLPGNMNEDIFIKKLYPTGEDCKGLTPLQISREYYPSFCDGNDVDKFIVPIRPEYHQRLFTEFCDDGSRQLSLNESVGDFIVEGNTIKKAYLTNSKIRKLKGGDIVLFYRSNDIKALTSLGVIEEVHYSQRKSEEIIEIIGKRSVYSKSEIESSKKPLSVILFKHHMNLKKPVKLSTLIGSGILKGQPQTIQEIDGDKFSMIKELGEINERFTIH